MEAGGGRRGGEVEVVSRMVGKKFAVEGVSWLEQVFDMVAARSPNHPPLSLQIPDTVAFRYQRPASTTQWKTTQCRAKKRAATCRRTPFASASCRDGVRP
ncbi:MAG: hypothetical protein ACPIOQ_13975 [Promethearchaeia archaeon]